ncbi:MAG: tetratricopeptide repeat protein [Vallitaleaceae bacterium]|nr:tetratricopeptide repeat protein [Vallitaleaceae bacterium]
MANLCPICKSELNEKEYCSKCKMTISIYKKFKESSKLFYNQGLQRAKARDLSGAVEVLNRCIEYDKQNMDGRNLLGLVYFELGEPVLALRQWVISQNIQPTNNPATRYLDHIQNNQIVLERLNSAIVKYNQALTYINQGSTDLAVIQLKKIITLNPKFVKAYNLLALVYIKENEIEKAKRELVKVLDIDKNNYAARKYYLELVGDAKDVEIESEQEIQEKNIKKARRQVMINQSVQQFLGVVFGLAMGASLIYFLIMPNRLDTKELELQTQSIQLVEANTKADELSIQLETSDTKIRELEQQLKNAIDENDQFYVKDEKVQLLMLSISSYLKSNMEESANYLDSIDISDSTDGVLNSVYEELKLIVFSDAAKKAYDNGMYNYNLGKYEEASQFLETSVRYVSDATYSDDANYFLARSYQLLAKTDEAIAQFKVVVQNYPNSDRVSQSKKFITSLGGSLDE